LAQSTIPYLEGDLKIRRILRGDGPKEESGGEGKKKKQAAKPRDRAAIVA